MQERHSIIRSLLKKNHNMETNNTVEILFVEDNPRDAEIALRALKKHKLINHIVHVKDGQEALDWLFGTGSYEGRDPTHRPKVVLLDLKLPKVSGLEVLHAMRENTTTALIPVVILTSSREEGDVIKSYKLDHAADANEIVHLPLVVMPPFDHAESHRRTIDLAEFAKERLVTAKDFKKAPPLIRDNFKRFCLNTGNKLHRFRQHAHGRRRYSGIPVPACAPGHKRSGHPQSAAGAAAS